MGEHLNFSQSTAAAMVRVIEADFRSDPRWINYIASHADATIYHHPGWLGALEEEYGRRCIALACEDTTGNFQGILPLFETRGLPVKLPGYQLGRRLSSLPRTPMAGPLWNNASALIALSRALVQRLDSEPGLQLEVKTTTPGLDALVEGLQSQRWRTSYAYPLPRAGGSLAECTRGSEACESCTALRFGKSRTHLSIMHSVKKAAKLGVHVRLAESLVELRAWYDVYLETMRRNLVPARPYRFLKSLWQNLHAIGAMRLWIASLDSRGERIIAGVLVLRYGKTAFYALGGAREYDLTLHPYDLLHWYAIRDCCQSGYCHYDFGEVPENHPGLEQYKKKWGSEPVQLYRYYYPSLAESRKRHFPKLLWALAGAAWRRVPLKVTAFMSDCVYRYL